MSIFDRLSDVIKSYLNDEDARIFGNHQNGSRNDADYNAAYDELNEYLNKDKARTSYWSDEASENRQQNENESSSSHTSYADYLREEFAKRQSGRTAEREREKAKDPHPNVPEVLRKDFAELEIDFASTLMECKASYKTLLKKHHPDRHAGHERNMKKATEKSARINVSYRRIETWYETGKID
jgi:DnaJ-domain-containing protein 1